MLSHAVITFGFWRHVYLHFLEGSVIMINSSFQVRELTFAMLAVFCQLVVGLAAALEVRG